MFFRFFFYLLPACIWLTLLFTFVRPLRMRWKGSVLLALALLAALLKFFWFRCFGGGAFRPELPMLVLRSMNFLYSSCMILGALALLPPWRRRTRRHVLVLAALAMTCVGWGLWEGVRVPSVETVEIELADLPPAFDGLRVVHLSDLHASPATCKAHFEGIVRRVNALDPDLVCITGDFADGTPEARGDQLAPLAALRARYGVLGCSGNHEFYSDYAAWRPRLESYGVKMLDNACVLVTNGTATLAVGGILDGAARRHGGARFAAGPDMAATFAAAPGDAFRVLMRHVPEMDRMALRASRVGLQLSGHTHGGAVLGFDRLVKNMNQNHVRGLYREDPCPLYVSPGTGQWAGFPLRLGVPARIVTLVLRRVKREG